MPSTFDILKVLDIARTAGAFLLAMRPQVMGKADIKGDGSPVTDADRGASEIVIKGLQALTPDIPVISEENTKEQNAAVQTASNSYWIVDPLDGTRSYLDGYDGFGVHIGLIVNGEPVAAAIYFPAQGVAYYTDGANGAFMQKDGAAPVPVCVNTAEGAGGLTAAVSWVKARQPVLAAGAVYKPLPFVGGDRVCQAAVGVVDLALVENPFSYWDIAAAHAFLRAAGGELFDLNNGAPVRYPSDRLYVLPCIGGAPALVSKYRQAFSDAVKALPPPKRKPVNNGNPPKPPGL